MIAQIDGALRHFRFFATKTWASGEVGRRRTDPGRVFRVTICAAIRQALNEKR
jgi:hypothetical protein